MSDITYVTKETLEQMQQELTRLKTKGRAEIAKAIAEAREKGDLKENAEYDAAKEAQGYHEARIAQLEATIINARIINMKDIDISRVSILSKVTILNLKNQKQMTYQLVSENEADIKSGKLSVGSPIGKALLGKKTGEVFDVNTPAGILQFKVEKIAI
ncbi:MAG: transcription elongation factor GreA [Chitinophagaceae bacterium]|jgi:transcription elongation factor GreA|nr:MAG: transcription elongation factor GreA [Chitinophagaceae bacterium]